MMSLIAGLYKQVRRSGWNQVYRQNIFHDQAIVNYFSNIFIMGFIKLGGYKKGEKFLLCGILSHLFM